VLVLAATATVVLAACGSSAKTASASAAGSSRSVQVLYTVTSGNLVETAAGRVTLTSTKTGKVTATIAVAGPEASQVAAGQSVALTFVQLPAGAGRFFGSGSPRPSAAPSAGTGGSGFSGGSGYSGGGGGAGFFGQGGASRFRGKTATATVTAVQAGTNGSVTATIAIAKLPAGVTAKYIGIAQIQVKVLASNVLIVPRAAIKGSGSSATVQLLQSGKTVTQSVTVGQETATEAQITSGLSAGQSIIYTRTFNGFPGGRNGRPGGYGGFFGGGQGGSSSGQPTNSTGGV
jgi:hypothetical protein